MNLLDRLFIFFYSFTDKKEDSYKIPGALIGFCFAIFYMIFLMGASLLFKFQITKGIHMVGGTIGVILSTYYYYTYYLEKDDRYKSLIKKYKTKSSSIKSAYETSVILVFIALIILFVVTAIFYSKHKNNL